MSCKVRFAPSPTGFMHIGNARIAIINYLFCKKNQGVFLLRIDDTDVLRSRKECEDAILRDVAWLGIKYDEFFRQSERIARYDEIKNKLISSGALYKCYETQEELDYKRKNAISKGRHPVYDREALRLTDAEKAKLDGEGVPHYWRFKLPHETVKWNDLIMGEVSYDLSSVSDPVVMKADGAYLYTFSSVIDDIESNITHIVRGQDHVTNTATHIAMFDEISNHQYKVDFAHLSLLVNKDGSQFSKRLGSTNLGDIRAQGVDPMAINSLLATLGSALDTVHFSSIDDLAEYFDITKFSTNSPKFDIEDIFNINKKLLHIKTYDEISKEIGSENCPSKEAFDIIIENIDSLNDFAKWKMILDDSFIADVDFSESEKDVLKVAVNTLKDMDALDEASGKSFLETVKNKAGVSGKLLYMPLRKALTGEEHGPNLAQLLELIGKKEVLRRINAASG